MKPSTRQFVHLPVPPASGTGMALQRGLSLIELMISITIGMIILVALSTLFINQSRSRIEMDKSNRMIDNGRYALQLLSDDLKLAGYYGEFVPIPGASPVPPMPGALPDPCSTTATDMANSDGAFALQLAIQGVNATTTTTPAFSPLCAAIATANSVTLNPGSDIVVVRRVTTATPLTSPVNGVFNFQASLCQYDAASFRIDTNPANLTLRQLLCTKTSTTPYAVVRQFMVDIYFVSTDDKVGDQIPTLKRIEIDPNTQKFVVTPLVEGIEYMQLEYGLDTSGDGIVDSYTANPALADWPNVVAVQMYLLARNIESTKGYTDTKTYALGSAGSFTPTGTDVQYKRHAYTQYIRLVNPAGRREIQ